MKRLSSKLKAEIWKFCNIESATFLILKNTLEEKYSTPGWKITLIVPFFKVTHYVKSVLEFFWSVFSHIGAEYGEILCISPYSVRRQEIADQKNSEWGHFSPSDLNNTTLLLKLFQRFTISNKRFSNSSKRHSIARGMT